MIQVLFLDEYDCCRAPMATGLAKAESVSDASFFCAGIHTRGIAPGVAEVLTEVNAMPQPVKNLTMDKIDWISIDLVITLSDQAARLLPQLPGMPTLLRWDLPGESGEENHSHDLDSLRQLREELLRRMKLLALPGWLNVMARMKRNGEFVMDHLHEGIIAHDANRIITWFNRAAEHITGYSREDVIGQDCHIVFEGNFCGQKCSFCDGPPNFEHVDYPLKIVTKDGRQKRIEMAVTAMRDDDGQFQGVLASFKDVTEVSHLRRRLKEVTHFHGIIGNDEKMHTVYELITDLAVSDCPVLIQGESGTGKELVACAIHEESQRAGRPFVTVNCGALPEGILESELFGHVRGAFTGAIRDKKGRFELAHEGTIFLDEVGELSPITQVKLLRVLQEGVFDLVGGEKPVRVDVRILSATNKDLRDMVRQGRFREDLFYRLCVVPIMLPPLRERRNDIPLLTSHFVARFSKEMKRDITIISDEALRVMMDYPWPGNIRELQNAIQYAYVKCRERILQLEHLPPEIYAHSPTTVFPSFRRRRRKLKMDRVQEAMHKAGNNKAKAAELLHVSRATLYRFLEEEKIH